MSVYLQDIPLSDARAALDKALQESNLPGVLGIETLPLDESVLGRTLAEPVWARMSSPHYHASAMDGFAVIAQDTISAQPSNPVILSVSEKRSAYVDTGDPLPDWADAVIPIENVETLDALGSLVMGLRQPDSIRIRMPVSPWSHIRPMGEDIVATQLVLPAGHSLRPVDLGAIAACGHDHVHVARKPRVAIIPTGTELVEIGKPVRPGNIIEYNSLVLAAQVNAWGGIATRWPIVNDEIEAICSAIQDAAHDHDLVLLNAGSSAGSEDYSASAVQRLGKLLVHGIAVRPGHPVILGMLKGEKVIIGVPGYPVSAAITGELFVEPLLSRWLGKRSEEPTYIKAELTRKVTSPGGDDDFLRVAVGRVGDRILAAPLSRGAGVITSLIRADGLALLPRGTQGMSAGETVEVRLYTSPAEIEHTLFAIGSHDITLDLLAQFLASYQRKLVSANTGSLGGLLALKRGEAHLAGTHLLDPQTGEFNLPYIRHYLPGLPVKVLGLVGRQQGLLVKKDNPLRITSLEDLRRPEVIFVNRQRGAGTRVLLDYQLSLKGIASDAIRGYNQEEYTHLAVAAAIASGRADTGLGIAAAAQALELDFVPLFHERYDLVIPTKYYHSDLLAPLFKILEHIDFRRQVAALPGYDLTPMGTLIADMG